MTNTSINKQLADVSDINVGDIPSARTTEQSSGVEGAPAETERQQFEAFCKDKFDCSNFSFSTTPDGVYFNTVQSKTFGGRIQPNYADVQMLWNIWQARGQVPDGFALVPIEPTDAMLSAMHEEMYDVRNQKWHDGLGSVYRAMLSAAPKD